MLDSFYHMTFNYFEITFFVLKMLGFYHIYTTLLWMSFHNITKICKPPVIYGFLYMVLYNHSQTQCQILSDQI